MNADLDCPAARSIVSLYADGELDGAESAALERHIVSCDACRQALAAERALKSALRALPRPPAPPGLAERVRAALPKPPPPRFARPWFRWAPALAAGLALFLIGGIVGHWALPPNGGGVQREVIAAHIRALVSDRTTDVASSDRHTVKPWFAGRIEIAPPVEDLASSGFPLLGARVDFVEGRRAAAIVYRRRQHVISLFVWPGTDHGRTGMAFRGYNVVLWSADGLTFAAVSDLNRAELETFASLIPGKPPPSRTR